jgi:diacylglycerol O-acyltransferase / wax synthase
LHQSFLHSTLFGVFMVTRVKATLATLAASAVASSAARVAAQAVTKKVKKDVRRAVTGTLGMSGERMTKVDTAWLRMDSASNLMMIVGVWTLKPQVPYDALCERVEGSLLKFRRFRQRVVEDSAGATWVDDKDFDISKHIIIEKLPHVAKGLEQNALQDRVAELAMKPLDPRRPLWQLHLIEDYDGGSVLIVRIHHCIADGIALIAVSMSMVDGGPKPPERAPKAEKRGGLDGAEDWIAGTLIKSLTQLAVKTLGKTGDNVASTLEMLTDPKQGMNNTVHMAKIAYQLASDAAALVLMPDDSPTRLKGTPGITKKVAWCQPIPLDEVKAVGKALNCSLNDVLLSCVAGAIGEYLRALGDDTTGQEIRAMVPVNLRPLDQAHKLGNNFGLAPLVLPIGVENPIERVYEVRRRMGHLKGAPGFWHACVGGNAHQTCATGDVEPLFQKNHSCDDQCARPERKAEILRFYLGAKPVLGAAKRQCWPRSLYLELRWWCPIRHHQRCHAVPRSAKDH